MVRKECLFTERCLSFTNHLNPLGLTLQKDWDPVLWLSITWESLQGSAWDSHEKLEAQWSARGKETFQPIEQGLCLSHLKGNT